MKNVLTTLATALLAALNALSITVEWEVDAERARSEAISAYHGETLTLAPDFGDTNITASVIYYQTNGMGSAWWSTDSLVFHPTNDIGAASYRFFVAAEDAAGRVYRANGTLRLLDSPGFVPNALPLPVEVLDYSTIEVANAPYYERAVVTSISNIAVNAAASADTANMNVGLCATKNELNNHVGNTTKHITADERARWNGKQNALPLAVGDSSKAASLKLVVSGNGANTANNTRAVALGYGLTVSGNNAFAANNQNEATGVNSAAFGYKTKAKGEDAFSIGRETIASGNQSFATGQGCEASGHYSFAAGWSAFAEGNSSFALGDTARATGDYSLALGANATAAADISIAMGCGTEVTDEFALAWNGDYQETYSSHGNGTFNINPQGGANGVYIGESTLPEIIRREAFPAVFDALILRGANGDTNTLYRITVENGVISATPYTP